MSKVGAAFYLLFILLVLGWWVNSGRKPEPVLTRVAVGSEFADSVPVEEEPFSASAKAGLTPAGAGILPHQLPTAIPVIAKFYRELAARQGISTFIIIAPDHTDAGHSKISYSTARFVTPFSVLNPDQKLISDLAGSGLASRDEAAFDREHSIGSQILLIGRYFPKATIVPVIFRSDVTPDEATRFGGFLASKLNKSTFLLASLDFSHYLDRERALEQDELSAKILSELDGVKIKSINVDSPAVLESFVSALKLSHQTKLLNMSVSNASDYSSERSFTTGYVVGLWGSN